ncbi:MAG: hypothetical protein JJ916_05990 [Phycisphaerales bacterium]|nr:hypothetical protein [Phycisphaerales bacterium]
MIRGVSIVASAVLLSGCAGTPDRSGDFVSTPPTSDIGRFVADRQPWSFRGVAGYEYRTPNSIIRTTSTDRKILERLPPFIELSILHYQSDLVRLPRPKKPIETYFFQSRSQWASMTEALMGERSPVYLSIERGGYAYNHIGVFFDLGPRDSFVICAHEGWHQYAHSTFAGPMPVWLDEGVACVMEGFKWDEQFPDHPRFHPWANIERFDQLRRAVSNESLMPVHTLLTLRPQDLIERGAQSGSSQPAALVYYAQVWALIHFLREGEGGMYREGFETLLQDCSTDGLRARLGGQDLKQFNTRRTGTKTLLAYLPEGMTLSQLDAEYQRFVRRIVGVGGRDAVVAGRSPLQ